MTQSANLQWEEGEKICSAHWHSENGIAPHKKIQIADDTLTADIAYRLACAGTAMLYKGDFQNARQLLQALVRRVDKPSKKSTRADRVTKEKTKSPLDAFNLHRLTQSQRARILGMVLIHVNADHTIPLRRAPDIAQACHEAYGTQETSYVISLRELLGVISAHEWRKTGVQVLTRDDEEVRIHPHYGVFSPVRSEYIDLVLKAPLPEAIKNSSIAFDIGTGTGVLAIILALRDVQRIIATDLSDRAIACAKENIDHLGLNSQIEIHQTNLFPETKAALIVCNPPWLPARPSSSLEHAVYDPESQMLKGFLSGLKDHLLPNGEGWLILSDLAEHLGLRAREEFLNWIDQAGLKVIAHLDTKPTHNKAFDRADALYAARSKEVTSLWRLTQK
ncbi:methyltransferase [Polynucleobacter sp. MG-28-Ekke-A2]|uniref:methyltransferase n=1 Tax=unclassified Polynucleobacter TaxID=2640945 RepID=UPI001C0C4AE5|nr:methyltransferase [Polynucleobacter sp. MG-28-Ekke-A2]MBU3639894.1 class I SAM-dependent methyltransferase [Polynucleobacter sp. AP-RePozz3-80-G7]MEA9602022.1 class I SAM-dependent methyltransferase [Polynucleobacter sp. MG-28-Ekke-A2]